MKDVVEKLMNLGEKKNPDQLEAYASENKVVTVRIATNEIVEAKELATKGCSLRLAKNKSIGFASSNDTTHLDDLVDRCQKLSASKDADRFFKAFAMPQKIIPVPNLYDGKILDLSLEETVEWGKQILDIGLGLDSNVDISGSINVVSEKCWVQNSNGVDASDVNAFLICSLTVERGEENSSLGEIASRTIKGFNIENTVRNTIEGLKLNNHKKVTPGKYKVIFGTHAMANLLEHVIDYAVKLSSIDAGFSYLIGRLGEKIADERFTLSDDGRHPTGIGTKTVDDEGIPTQKNVIIDKGLLKTFYGDTYYVNKMSEKFPGLKATGNGFRFGAVPGRDYSILPSSSPTNLVVEKGNMSMEELVSEVKQGIYVGRIWYTYPINPTVGEFSCTNRSNTFWIEDGEIRESILPNSFRINDNILNLLRNIIGMTEKREQSFIWGGVAGCISPHVGFGKVNVSYSK